MQFLSRYLDSGYGAVGVSFYPNFFLLIIALISKGEFYFKSVDPRTTTFVVEG